MTVLRALLITTMLLTMATLEPVAARQNGSQRPKVEPRSVRLKLSLLIPGQPDIGLKEVRIKLNHFLKDFNLSLQEFLDRRHRDPADAKVQQVLKSVAFERFMSKRTIQVVRDPLGRFQIFDGHHLALSLRMLEIDEADVDLHEDFFVPLNGRNRQTLETRMEEYHAYMVENKLIRLVNEYGRNLSFDDLPSTPEEMRNNPFRSVAWILKKAGVYSDLDVPMQEFAWAGFLQKEFRRRSWKRDFDTDHEFMIALRRSLTILSHLDEDTKKELPGYLAIPSPEKRRRLREFKERILGDCETLLNEYDI